MEIIHLIAVFIFAAFALIVYLSTRRISDKEYLSNFGKTGFVSILFSLLASLVGGWMFFGLTELGKTAGFAALAIGLGYMIGLIIFSMSAGKIYSLMMKQESHNLVDVIGSCFNSRVHKAATLVNIIFFIGVISAQYLAMFTFFKSILNIESPLLSISVALIVILYTTYGGFKGVIVSDKLQFIAIAILAAFILPLIGAKEEHLSSLPSVYFSGLGNGIAFLIVALTLFPASIFCRADIWQRVASAKSANDFRLAIFLAIPLLLVFYLVFTLLGMTVAETESNPVELLHSFMSEQLNSSSMSFIILVTGIGSALLSTIDTNTNVAVGVISRLAIKQEVDRVNFYRKISFGVGIICFVMATVAANIVELIIAAGAIILVLLPTVICLLRLEDKANNSQQESAFWSISIGLLALIITLVFVNSTIAFIIGFLASSGTWFITKLFTKGGVK
ncbi:MAG TPA: hypothetical protein DCS30_00535 [Rhizobiales bacterium]|nr:hypothetical protein [Hyphomicrobiales bacterium]